MPDTTKYPSWFHERKACWLELPGITHDDLPLAIQQRIEAAFRAGHNAGFYSGEASERDEKWPDGYLMLDAAWQRHKAQDAPTKGEQASAHKPGATSTS